MTFPPPSIKQTYVLLNIPLSFRRRRGWHVYTSADAGIFVFTSDGELVTKYVGEPYTMCHDPEIRLEGDGEFLYAARNNNGEGIKVNAQTGEVVLHLPFPEESGLGLEVFKPTAITVAANGDIFLSDGYASNIIFRFDKVGKYLSHFGQKGKGCASSTPPTG